MMPMEDIPSPRTAGEYKQFWFVKGVPEFECFKLKYYVHYSEKVD